MPKVINCHWFCPICPLQSSSLILSTVLIGGVLWIIPAVSWIPVLIWVVPFSCEWPRRFLGPESVFLPLLTSSEFPALFPTFRCCGIAQPLDIDAPPPKLTRERVEANFMRERLSAQEATLLLTKLLTEKRWICDWFVMWYKASMTECNQYGYLEIQTDMSSICRLNAMKFDNENGVLTFLFLLLEPESHYCRLRLYSSSPSILHSFFSSFSPSFILFFILSFIHSLFPSCDVSVSPPWVSPIHLFLYTFIHSFIHSSIHSLIHLIFPFPISVSPTPITLSKSSIVISVSSFDSFIHSFIPSLTWHFRFSSSCLVNSAHSVIIHSFI